MAPGSFASVALADHPQIMLPIIFYNLAQHLVASMVDLTCSKTGPARACLLRLKARAY